MGIFGDKTGMDCSPNEDGTITCRKYKIHKNSKLATGSEATFVQDPKSCDVSLFGRNSLNEEDERDFERIKRKLKAECRGGIN
jgi:hypothetical protein